MTFRIAAVSFLNTVPLVDWLYRLDGDEVDLTRALPSRLADMLEAGMADVALVPVADILSRKTGGIIPVSGIACHGAVDSVKLFTTGELAELSHIAADRGSHSSVALLRVLLAEMHGQVPEIRSVKPAVGAPPARNQGILIIGDKCFEYERYLREAGLQDVRAWDLGQLWWDLTGLPFVFATWAVSPGYPARAGAQSVARLQEILSESLRDGMEHLAEIVEREVSLGRLGPGGYATYAAIDYYFRQSLHFTIGEQGLAGIAKFHELARRHGVILERTPPTIL